MRNAMLFVGFVVGFGTYLGLASAIGRYLQRRVRVSPRWLRAQERHEMARATRQMTRWRSPRERIEMTRRAWDQ